MDAPAVPQLVVGLGALGGLAMLACVTHVRGDYVADYYWKYMFFVCLDDIQVCTVCMCKGELTPQACMPCVPIIWTNSIFCWVEN